MHMVDVNVLVALLDVDHQSHARARRWWSESAATGERFGVPDLVWVGVVRTITNTRAVMVAVDFEEAWAAVAALAADPRYLQVDGGPAGMQEFARIGTEADARGNLVTDAYIAATAVSLGATVVTFDRDFRKFDGVRVLEPA